MASLRGLLLACAVATACGPEAPPATPGPAETHADLPGHAWPEGRTFVYAMDWSVDAGFDPQTGSPVGLPLAGGMHLKGELHVQAIGAREDGTLAAIWFQDLTVRELTVNGEPLELDADALVGSRAYFVIDADGGVPRSWYPPDASSLFRHVMGGVITRFDLRGAAASGTRIVPTGHGLAEVAYVATGEDGKVRRQLQRLVRFDGFPGAEAEAALADGAADIHIDADGVPLRIDERENASASESGWSFGSQDRFVAARVRVDDGARVTIPEDLETFEEDDPLDPPDATESEQVFARQMAEDFAVQDIANAMAALDGGLLPGRGFISKATGLLRGWPEEAAQMEGVALSASGPGRQLAFDVLASAGTPEAQAVMRGLLDRDEVAEWPEYPLLVGRFAFVYRPTQETAQWLLGLEADLRVAGDERADAVLYPIGSVARSIAIDHPWLAEAMHARLVECLEAQSEDPEARLAPLAGLGNLARLEDRGRIVPFVTHPEGSVRSGAILALRNMPAADSTEAVFAALNDIDDHVAANALGVLAGHHLGPEGSARLARVVLSNAHNPDIDHGFVNALGERIDDDPSVRTALQEIAARTRDRDLVARIGFLIAS